ncbi:hypothetical protein NQ317_008490 [Molorchus minor]|uniref:Uncharacterized protein n=1 Tax=Molorchus minor TaxID=1323400 RepID=A0ABQ9JJN7_9CUCU|nr:hypothetical protein NQ317_008490 [Molorchus minor]
MLHVILVTAYEDLQRHYWQMLRRAGWKSTTVAEGYVENSIENKTKIANQVLVGTTTSAITKTVNVSESNIPSNINFENCTNVTFNLNVNK